ncbi:microtubule-destabilizing protein 60-like isoform X2 [Corylus avellana]|uniref:microtubule-destabilizing protein 60-like isoform X2 n=1 Tax=Corylus avellana TaxID=13451 RepID=UPI002869F5D7|nr:microtubule-destabilizing protein 60-like isoform X2 [Corylus avellana]
MDLIGKNTGTVTPVKDTRVSRSKIQENHKLAENFNPNVSHSSPGQKSTSSPVIKSTKAQKSVVKNPNPVGYLPRNKIRERKFVVAKKNSKKENVGLKVECKCKEKAGGGDIKKCLCVAYENLRASQEEFFKNRSEQAGQADHLKGYDIAESELEKEIEKGLMLQDLKVEDGYEGNAGESDTSPLNGSGSQIGSSTIKRRRDKLLEEARKSVPEPGSGRVMHLVKAFEKLLSIPISKDSDEKDEEEEKEEKEEEDNKKKAMKWALPGLQVPKVPETQVSSSSFCPSDLFLTSENLGLDSQISVSSSWDSSQGSVSSRTSNGGRRSRRNSSESSATMGGRRWKKQQLKVTSQKPFKLRTEQRGRLKEEEFMKKLQEMVIEDEKQRIPVAQGLPWTTDEPECLIKPPVKEITRPVDLKLHSDMRAVERAEFDNQVAEKLSLFEQYKMERERQQKMAEEEEIRRLRKELVPKAQPMPYFDRPFIPRRSMKHPTIPKEPKFHIPQQKKIKCCLSWNDISTYTYQQ